MTQVGTPRGDTLFMGPHRLDYPSFACARAVIGDRAVNPATWELAWIAPFEKLLTTVESHISLRGIVFTGAPGFFPSELDAGILALTADPKAWEAFCRRLAGCFHRIARMPWNTVAALGADCTGPGLELALACQTRIAAAGRGIRIGFPEIAFGRIPSFGGTQRLSRLLGLTRAATWLAAGRTATVEEAAREEILHEVVPEHQLAARALDYAEGRARPKPAPKLPWFSERTSLGRNRAFRRIEAETLTAVPAAYAAPRTAVEAARQGLGVSIERGLEIEARLGAEILETPEGRELSRVERLRAEARRITPGSTDAAVPTVPEPGLLGPSELVEIAGAPGSDAAPFEAARREAIREGRIPVRIATPGRSIIRRLLGIQLAQALALLPEGLSIAEIDAAAEAHGLPAGPFRWIDRLGVRQVLDMMRGLDAAHGPRFRPGDALTWLLEASPSAPPRFRGEDGQAVDARAAQVLGVEWASAERGPANDAVRAEAEDRLVLCMAAEGLRAVRERAVDSADAVDLAAIFGLGYPSIRGGPLRDLTRRGAAGRTRLRELAERHGEAFRAPAETPLTP